jgi:hypothetical protein
VQRKNAALAAGGFWSHATSTLRYVPRILSVLLIAASFGYIANSLGKFLLPNYDAMITAFMFAPCVGLQHRIPVALEVL